MKEAAERGVSVGWPGALAAIRLVSLGPAYRVVHTPPAWKLKLIYDSADSLFSGGHCLLIATRQYITGKYGGYDSFNYGTRALL